MSDQLYLVTNIHLLLPTIYPKHQNNILHRPIFETSSINDHLSQVTLQPLSG